MAEMYAVSYDESTGRWLVTREGQTISGVHRSQDEAAEFARRRLRSAEGGTLTIYDASGGFEAVEEISRGET